MTEFKCTRKFTEAVAPRLASISVKDQSEPNNLTDGLEDVDELVLHAKMSTGGNCHENFVTSPIL